MLLENRSLLEIFGRVFWTLFVAILLAFYAPLFIVDFNSVNKVEASVTDSINFQAKLRTSSQSNISDGYYYFRARIYDDPVSSDSGNILMETDYIYDGSVSSVTGSSLVYTDPNSEEGSIKPGMVIWNTTDATYAIVDSINTSTNTIQLDRDMSSTWTNGELLSTKIQVTDGIFNLKIVDLDDEDLSDFDLEYLYLGISFDDSANASDVLNENFDPRMRLSSVAYAYHAGMAGDIETRYWDRTGTTLTPLTAGDDLKFRDDLENLIFGSDNDYQFGYDSTEDQLEITDGSNLLLSVKDTGSIGDVLVTGNISVDGAVVFNESGEDFDFRVEGADDENLFIVDSGTSNVGVGLGGSGGSETLESMFQVGSSESRGDLTVYGGHNFQGQIDLYDSSDFADFDEINDVFVYDTNLDSDGGAWRCNEYAKSTSWYNETLNTSTRGSSRCFPEKALLVATDDYLYILDSSDNSLWMRFDDSYRFYVGSDLDLTSVAMLNGILYVSSFGSNADTSGVQVVDFIKDRGERYTRYRDSAYVYSGISKYGISDRNITNYDASINTGKYVISESNSYDVSVKQINGKTYFAVATDSGFSIVNTTDELVYDYSDDSGDDYVAIWLTKKGDVYAANDTKAQLERWNNVISDSSDENPGTPDFIWDQSSTPAVTNTDVSIHAFAPDQLYVSEGNSLVNSGSDLIYLAQGFLLTAIHDNNYSGTDGAVKYYKKDYISELLLGDIRGMWGFTDNSSSTTIDDISISNNNFTASANTDTLDFSGVRGLGLSLNGEYAEMNDDSDFDFDSTDSFTISIWAKHDTIATDSDYLLVKSEAGTNGGFKLYMDSDGNYIFELDDDSTWNPDVSLTSTNDYDDNLWHNIVIVKESNLKISLIVDGGVMDSDDSISSLGSLANDDKLYLGIDDDGSSYSWVGSLDELMISAEELDVDLVKRLYNTGKNSLNNHAASNVSGISDNDELQQLYGNSNSTTAVELDSSGEYIYVSTNDTADGGGVSVIGLNSDSVIDIYGSDASKSDRNSNSWDATTGYDDIIAIGLSGSVEALLNDSALGSYNKATIAFASDSMLWIENSNLSISDALDQITSSNLIKSDITATDFFRISDPNNSFRYDVSNTDSSPNLNINGSFNPVLEIDANGSSQGYAFQNVSFENLLSESSFETDSDSNGIANSWTSSGLSNYSLSSTSKYGSYSQSLTAEDDSDYLYQSITEYSDYVGETVTASLWVKSTESEKLRLYITDGVDDTFAEADIIGGEEFTRVWVRHRVNSDATGLTFRIYPVKDGSGTVLIDGAMLQKGSLLTNFVEQVEAGQLVNNNFVPDTADSYDLGSTSASWDALYLGDDDGINFGVDQDWNLFYDESSTDMLNLEDRLGNNIWSISDQGSTANFLIASTSEWQFRDEDMAISSGSSGNINLEADSVLNIDSPEVSFSNSSGIEFSIQDNLGSSMSFSDGTNSYLEFETTDGSEVITLGDSNSRVDSYNYGDIEFNGQISIESISNIKDVFVYDTKKDIDGGAWRINSTAKSSSWYKETLNTSSRGDKREFPEVAILVACDDYVYIYDAETNQMWMRFNQGGASTSNMNMIGYSSWDLVSVYAKNGVIYVGGKPNSDPISFIRDGAYSLETGEITYRGSILQRNSGKGQV